MVRCNLRRRLWSLLGRPGPGLVYSSGRGIRVLSHFLYSSFHLWFRFQLKARILSFSLEPREVVFWGEFSSQVEDVVFTVNIVANIENSCLSQVQNMTSQSLIWPKSLGFRGAGVPWNCSPQSISSTWKLVRIQILGPYPAPTEF